MKFLFPATLTLLFCLFPTRSTSFGPRFASAQSPEPAVNACELNSHYLDNAHHLAGEDSIIIAIARLGAGERSREYNQRRLHNVRVYLTEHSWHRDPKTVVTAEGDRVKGYGRIDLYVRGALWASLAVRRNQDLAVGSCLSPSRSFYPYLDRKPRAKPRRQRAMQLR